MFSLNFEENLSRKSQEFLTKVAHDPTVLTHINEIIGTNLNQFVPMRTGTLRGSMHAEADGVHWNTPYAHYQYEGTIYIVNHPIFNKGRIVGWKSDPGEGTKINSGRELGVPGYLAGWTFGYTTPGTKHHWTEAYTNNQWGMGGAGLKAKINKEITQYIKKIAGMFWAFSRN